METQSSSVSTCYCSSVENYLCFLSFLSCVLLGYVHIELAFFSCWILWCLMDCFLWNKVSYSIIKLKKCNLNTLLTDKLWLSGVCLKLFIFTFPILKLNFTFTLFPSFFKVVVKDVILRCWERIVERVWLLYWHLWKLVKKYHLYLNFLFTVTFLSCFSE